MQIAKIQTSSLYKKIIIGFGIATVVLFGLIAYFSFSKTIVVVTVNPKQVATTAAMSVKKDLTEEEKISPTVLPGYLLSTTVEGNQMFSNPNKDATEVEAQAIGTVTIYNNWSQTQPLAATTRLLTPEGILFRIKNRVDIPAGGKVENIEVYADKAGVSGNISPTRFTIPGLWPGLQEKIYAESFAPMTGGLRNATVITQQNISVAKQTLIKNLIKKAITELEQTDEVRNNKDTISEQAVATVILSEQSSVEAGTEASSFELSLKIKVIAVVINQTQMKDKATTQLKESLDDDQQLQDNTPVQITYAVPDYNLDKQTATVSVTATGTAVPRLSSSIFDRDKITGKDSQEIKEYFSNFDEIKNVDIQFSPFWVRTAPTLKDHIEIKIQN